MAVLASSQPSEPRVQTTGAQIISQRADITDRQNIQLHWIAIESVPEIWRRLEAVGLMTTEACGDTPRVILGSPVAGIAADEILDPTPVIREIVDTPSWAPATTCGSVAACPRRPAWPSGWGRS